MSANPAFAGMGENVASIQDWFDGRVTLRAAFLARFGAAGMALTHVAEDGAFRRYFRLAYRGGTALLMETVPANTDIATPGHALRDFVEIGAFLRANGLHTPEIYALDEAHGYALLEDFGTQSFRGALDAGAPVADVYGLAADVLVYLRGLDAGGLDLPEYYGSLVHGNRRRVIDWYMPVVLGRRNPDGLAEEYLRVWDAIEGGLPPCPRGLLHVDYHLENLMWMPDRPGLQAAGILDYQWAMTGPMPYDLVNLLEDARRDVPPAIKAAVRDRYCADMTRHERQVFDDWYLVLAAQFHCRIIGQFVRLAVLKGKPGYLQHLPRLSDYLRAELAQPLLQPMRDWLASHGLAFAEVPEIDPRLVPPLIRADAV